MITEWSIKGADPEGKPSELSGRGTRGAPSTTRSHLAHGFGKIPGEQNDE